MRVIDADLAQTIADQELTADDSGIVQFVLAHTPTIDVPPVVHGRWELKHIGVGHYWECSECHTNPCIYVTKNTKFCPNCGARMDGDDYE